MPSAEEISYTSDACTEAATAAEGATLADEEVAPVDCGLKVVLGARCMITANEGALLPITDTGFIGLRSNSLPLLLLRGISSST